MRLTISAAARLYGIHRATIHRHIKAGRLSCVFEPDGSRALDLSELIRCYGEPTNAPQEMRQVATGSATPDATGDATPRATGGQALPADLLAELVELTRQQGETLTAQREELAALRREVAELRALPAPGQLASHPDHPAAGDGQAPIADVSKGSANHTPRGDEQRPLPGQSDRPPVRSFADLLERLNSR